MPSVCIYFQVHQPFRLRHYTYFDIDRNDAYEDEGGSREAVGELARRCYLPANELLLQLLKKHRGDFRVAFSVTGTALDQFEKYAPGVLDGFKRLNDTGCVEFLGETYYHSLAFLFSAPEFKQQVQLHAKRMEALFGQTPRTFRHTELLYNNALARRIDKMGYAAILTEGGIRILGWRSPNAVYRPVGCGKLKCLLRNQRLSDDVAFRFSDPAGAGYPLTPAKFARWLGPSHAAGETINLFMDYGASGRRLWDGTGIFDFLKALPRQVLRLPGFRFQTPAEAVQPDAPGEELNVPKLVSWVDVERDATAWMGNEMQMDALQALYELERPVKRRKDAGRRHTWRLLQASDHFYYMCTKWFAADEAHKYPSPYASPYDAYVNYMNVLTDFANRMGP